MSAWLRHSDPRGWSRATRVVAALLFVAALALPQGVRRCATSIDAWRAARALDAVAIPRVDVSLEAPWPAVRVRVTSDAVDLDMRALTAALPERTRAAAWDALDPLWREALLRESPGMLALSRGRLRDDVATPPRLRALRERVDMVVNALQGLGPDALDPRALRAPVYYVDGDVPVATVAAVMHATSRGGVGLAVRGARGVGVLGHHARFCGVSPAVTLDVGPRRYVLRATRDVGDCRGGAGGGEFRETVIARDGGDRGMGALRRALAAAPWSLHASGDARRGGRAPADLVAAALAAEPWGAIAVRVQGDVPWRDCIAALAAARERDPGACGRPREGATGGCLFPDFELAFTPGSPR